MANIRIDLNGELMNGHEATFQAPCDCTAITGLIAYYPSGKELKSKTFTFRDAQANDLTGLGNLFAKGAFIKVILDSENGHAYIQNATTDKYLENKIPTTASDVGAASMYAVVWTPTNGETLLGYISDRIRNGFESGVIQIFGDIPSDIPTVFGAYALCKYQKHGDSFVHVILTVDGSLYTEQAKFIYGETSWAVGWSTVYLPLTGGHLNGNLTVPTYLGFNNCEVADYGVGEFQIRIKDRTNSANIRYISMPDMTSVAGMSEALKFVDFKDGYYTSCKIYGEHNITAGTTALTAGSSELTTGCIYQQYE